ncbi:MAG: FHA domain-containing protein [Acidobacteria bacterium]|nr:FHA domain-containing protein [Acidobacteriota bacterium]MDW7984211.1 FHA domain-containing protein [Acidobacteriota bacterium]
MKTLEVVPGQEWKLGRHPQCAVIIAHPSVSRFHARIFCDATGVYLEDLNTANGTFVNDQRIQGTVTLRDGDVIRLAQATNPDPIFLKFEDPSARLLEALVEGEKPSEAPAEASAVVEEAADVEVAPVPSAPMGWKGLLAMVRQPVVWIPIAIVLVGAIAVGVFLVSRFQTTQRPWQSVRVEPLRVRAGWLLTLQGPDVRPLPALRVWVHDQEATIQAAESGKLQVAVPDLGLGERGTRVVELRVERKGLVLFRQSIQYEIVPQIRAVQPTEVAVGQTVYIEGTGFTSHPGDVKVRVGNLEAPVVKATPGLIQFRVPVLTRQGVVDAPVEVRIGDWSERTVSLKVRPRDLPCYPLLFSATYVTANVWQVRSNLGCLFYVEGPAPADDRPDAPLPPSVQQVIQVLSLVFDKARNDPSVRWEVQESGRTPVLVAVGSSLGRPIQVGSWTQAVQNHVQARLSADRQGTPLPYWNAVVLNDLLDLFSRAQAPSRLPPDSNLRAILQRLRDQNLAVGGRGCPSLDDIQTLTPADREALENACLALPPYYGSVAGRWTGELENVFYLTLRDATVALQMDLQQKGSVLSGTATVETRSPKMRWTLPAVPVRGRLDLSRSVLELVLTLKRPFGTMTLQATLQGDTLAGSFSTSEGKQGNFRLQRSVSAPPP